MIRIRSKQDGFRRCGVAHSREPVEYPDDRFSKAELKSLKSEPMLVVEEIEDKAKTEAPKKKDTEKKGSEKKPEEPKKERPTDEGQAEEAIIAAMQQILTSGENLISGGRPDVKAVEEILGWQISAKERDALMEKLSPAE